jgi:cytoskeletal protein CcmA (bactofilin family)
MWGAKKPMAFSNNHTLISRSAKIIGDLYFDGELQIEGKICGNVIAEGEADAKVVVAENGVVEGNIQAPAAVINGNVKGDIYSSKHIELAAKAVIEGNIHYQSIEMVKGSQVNGGLIFRDSTTMPEKEFSAANEKKDEVQDD